eukprot:scaffold4659_cov352-Prasinococcus_capsulatus_cf.AAC.4
MSGRRSGGRCYMYCMDLLRGRAAVRRANRACDGAGAADAAVLASAHLGKAGGRCHFGSRRRPWGAPTAGARSAAWLQAAGPPIRRKDRRGGMWGPGARSGRCALRGAGGGAWPLNCASQSQTHQPSHLRYPLLLIFTCYLVSTNTRVLCWWGDVIAGPRQPSPSVGAAARRRNSGILHWPLACGALSGVQRGRFRRRLRPPPPHAPLAASSTTPREPTWHGGPG